MWNNSYTYLHTYWYYFPLFLVHFLYLNCRILQDYFSDFPMVPQEMKNKFRHIYWMVHVQTSDLSHGWHKFNSNMLPLRIIIIVEVNTIIRYKPRVLNRVLTERQWVKLTGRLFSTKYKPVVRKNRMPSNQNLCLYVSGTILSEDMILTASHCLSYFYHDMKVVVGQYYQDRRDPNEQIFDIEDVTQHKSWE